MPHARPTSLTIYACTATAGDLVERLFRESSENFRKSAIATQVQAGMEALVEVLRVAA